MKAYQKEIIVNVVSYIAKKYKGAFKKDINETLMYEIIALLDFRSLKESGTLCTDMTYKAREIGPVPELLYNGALSIEGSTYKTKQTDTEKYFISIKEPNLDYLRPSEIMILEEVLDEVISNNLTDEEVCNLSKKEIISWKKAYEKEVNSVLNLEDEFEGIKMKEEKDMTVPELTFLSFT